MGVDSISSQTYKRLPGRATVEFRDIESAWSTVFVEPEGGTIAGISAAVCGEEDAMLYHGSQVDCVALIAIAREQVLSMNAICALTDRYSPMYFVLAPPYELLYIRHIFARFPAPPPSLVFEKPLFIAMVGSRESVFAVSGQFDEIINRALDGMGD